MPSHPCDRITIEAEIGISEAPGESRIEFGAIAGAKTNAFLKALEDVRTALSNHTCEENCQLWYRYRLPMELNVASPEIERDDGVFVSTGFQVWIIDIKCERPGTGYWISYKEPRKGRPRLIKEKATGRRKKKGAAWAGSTDWTKLARRSPKKK